MSLDSQSGSRYGPRSDHHTPDGDAERNGLLRAQGTGGRRTAAASSTGRCRYHAHTYFEGPHLTRGGRSGEAHSPVAGNHTHDRRTPGGIREGQELSKQTRMMSTVRCWVFPGAEVSEPGAPWGEGLEGPSKSEKEKPGHVTAKALSSCDSWLLRKLAIYSIHKRI